VAKKRHKYSKLAVEAGSKNRRKDPPLPGGGGGVGGCSILQQPLYFTGKTHVFRVFMRFPREIRMFFAECVSCLFSSDFCA
jgi:hypothetical protein